VKKRFIPFLISSLFAYATLSADVATLGYDAFLQQLIIQNSACTKTIQPFGVSAYGFGVGRARLEHHEPGKISYAEGEFDLMYTQGLTECEGVSAILGYDNVYLNFTDNPFFRKKDFNSLDVGFLGYTTRVNRWLWQVGACAQISLDYGTIGGKYTRYTVLAWGRYTYTKTVNLHAGFYAFYNLRKNKVYPIIGFDWQPNKHWLISLIFPMNVSVNYLFNPCWSLSVAWLPIWSRHRVGNNEPDPRGIWENRNNGVHLALNYVTPGIIASVYAGQAFGGTLKIMDQTGRIATFFKYKSSPYAGLRLMAPF
jgi:hypothetical protein